MAVELNATIAQASLDNLQDIVVPAAPDFLPLAPGGVNAIKLSLFMC